MALLDLVVSASVTVLPTFCYVLALVVFSSHWCLASDTMVWPPMTLMPDLIFGSYRSPPQGILPVDTESLNSLWTGSAVVFNTKLTITCSLRCLDTIWRRHTHWLKA